MDSLGVRPAPIARITVAAPVTMSPLPKQFAFQNIRPVEQLPSRRLSEGFQKRLAVPVQCASFPFRVRQGFGKHLLPLRGFRLVRDIHWLDRSFLPRHGCELLFIGNHP